MKNPKKPIILYKNESKEKKEISNIQRSLDEKNVSLKLRKNKLNLINSINSNLTSTISDSKIKDNTMMLNNKKIKPKTKTNRPYNNSKINSKSKKIQKIDIETDNNIKFLKKNLKQINTDGDIIENNKITSIKITKVINPINNQLDNTKNKPKEIQEINIINNNTENNYKKLDKKRICSYKKDRTRTYNNTTSTNRNNLKNNISSFDKRKKYIVPMIKNKKKKEPKKEKSKKKETELEQTIKETKDILTMNLIKNKQIEYLREYQKYIDEFNNKLYKNNEKKFRCIQEEGIDLDELFIDEDENQNDTIDEIYEKEDGEEVEEDVVKESSI